MSACRLKVEHFRKEKNAAQKMADGLKRQVSIQKWILVHSLLCNANFLLSMSSSAIFLTLGIMSSMQ